MARQGGEPDQVFTIPVKYSLPADGPDHYRCFVLPTGLDHDAYVDGVEFRPGEPSHCASRAVVYGYHWQERKELAAASPDGSYSCFGGPGIASAGMLGGWAPGFTPTPHDPDAREANASQRHRCCGSESITILSGKPETDQSSLGLEFLRSLRPKAALRFCSDRSSSSTFAPGDSHYVAKASLTSAARCCSWWA